MNFFKLLFLVAAVTFLSDTTYACVCVNMGFSDSAAKAYYNAKSFDGAIFTGKIREIKDLSEGEDLGVGMMLPLRELQIDIEQYWFGVKKDKVTALTLGANTSCSMEWQKDQSLFFIASRNKRGLNVGSCDLSNWRGTYPDAEWTDYTKRILGPSKTFGKKVAKSESDLLVLEYPLWTIAR